MLTDWVLPNPPPSVHSLPSQTDLLAVSRSRSPSLFPSLYRSLSLSLCLSLCLSLRALGSKPSWVRGLAQALLRAEDVNVLVVDWVYTASFAYNRVVENYKEVAIEISVIINHLRVRVHQIRSSG